MELTGLTNCNNASVNRAILNLAQKLKLTRAELWADYLTGYGDMSTIPINIRFDVIVKLANKLYKR